MAYPWLRIKSTPDPLVKLTCYWLLAIFAAGAFTVTAPARADETLPEIEAKTFSVTVKRRSASGRVYLLETPGAEPLHVGKLVLFRKNELPVIAFRVLRDYPEKNQFAGKWVRRYNGMKELNAGDQYEAIEKLADRGNPVLTPEDHADLKELETEIPPPSESPAPLSSPIPSESTSPAELPTPSNPSGTLGPSKPYDSELDQSTTPPPKGAVDENYNPDLTPTDEAEIDDLSKITAEELLPLDRDWNWVTVGFGFFRNNGATSGTNAGYATAFDFKYAKTLRQMIYFRKKNIQDSIALEGGLGFYKLINFAAPNDSFSVIPFTVTLRYNLLLNEDFGTFMYAGLNKNFVATYSSADPANQTAETTAQGQLNSLLPAFGVGLLFRVGPGWYMRMDAGIDIVGIALLLRF